MENIKKENIMIFVPKIFDVGDKLEIDLNIKSLNIDGMIFISGKNQMKINIC
jgi:mannose/fructose/N-acetylgalactosamine-specific phosphotransferase system component IIB